MGHKTMTAVSRPKNAAWVDSNINMWEDQPVEEATSGWEAFHLRLPKPSSSPN